MCGFCWLIAVWPVLLLGQKATAHLPEDHMQNHTKRSTIHLDNNFSLAGTDQVFPPGDYLVLEDQELIEGVSWLAYRRTATFVEVPAIGTAGSLTQRFKVDHDELIAMLELDGRKANNDTTGDQKLSGSPF